MIRAVIFDLGHTLWDILPDDGTALDRAYAGMRATLIERLGRDDPPDAAALREAVRQALHEAGETYFTNPARLEQPPSHVWVDQGCRALGLRLDAALLREVTPPLFATEIDSLTCADGTLEAVRALAGDGYALGCITNTLADAPAIRAMLRRYEIEELMRSVVVSSEDGWRKPHGSLFEKALRELGIAAREAVFIGDSPLHDIGGAKGAGMHAVLTRQYVARPYAGFEPGPDAVVGHVRELRGVIAAIDARDQRG
ncbi:MAG: HAD family hydrolase [Dehalococcoidia bacterium]